MADTIERIYKLTVDGAQAARDLNAIAKSTSDLDKRMADSINSITKFGKALAGAFSVHEVISGFKSIIDSMDQIGKDAQKIGVGAEELQKLRYAAEFAGVGAEKMNAAVTKLAVGMSQLDKVTSKAGGVLRSAGVNDADDAEQALGTLADRFAAMPDGAQKTAEAVAVFGKAVGPDLIPFLNQGAEGIKKLTDEAERFGGVVTGKAIEQASEFNDNLARLERTSKGVGVQLAEGMLPAFKAISESFIDSAKTGDGFVSTGQKIGGLLVEVTGLGIKAAATLEALGLTLGAIAAIIANPGSARSIFREWQADIDQLNVDANAKIARLTDNLKRAQEAFAANPKPSFGQTPATDPLADAAAKQKEAAEAAKARALAEREAAKALREREKAEKDAADALERRLAFEKQWAVVTAQVNALQTEEEDLAPRLVRAKIAVADAAERALDSVSIEAAEWERLTLMLNDADEAHRQYAVTARNTILASKQSTEQVKKEANEWDLLGDSFNNFANQAANSAGHLSAAFSAMVQSLIKDLLLFWAKKYIVQAIIKLLPVSIGGGTFPENPVPSTDAAAVSVIPFARGGVLSQAISFPMALAGEAGPEAIMPLRRAADGNLGVQATTSPLNVTVNNFSDNTVTAKRTGPNDLEIVVEKARAAIAADLRTGGTLVSRALEQSYGIGRGAAAAF